MNSSSESSSSSSALNHDHHPHGSNIMRPQQHGLSAPGRSILRQTPPSVFQTPSHHGRRSYQQQQQPQPNNHQLYRQNFDSPFASPPPTVQKKMSAPPSSRQHNYYYARQTLDSPFCTPPPTLPRNNGSTSTSTSSSRTFNNNPSPGPMQPLILDPQRQQRQAPTMERNNSSNHSRSSHGGGGGAMPAVHKLLEAATRGIRDQTSSAVLQHGNHNHNRLHATPAVANQTESSSAAILARGAPQAGFLQKLGANIPEFKRRFFVLKPETNIYYYLSPNDTEPRGKIELEDSHIEELEQFPDGRYRFGISWDNGSPQQQQQQSRKPTIVLEARSKEIGQEWIQYLKNERVSSLKTKVEELTSETVAQKHTIQDLERQVQNFKMMEKDRDGALDDARKWKAQFERLDEALRVLTQRIRKPPRSSPTTTTPTSRNDDVEGEEEEEKKETNSLDNEPTDDTPTKNNRSHKKPEMALLDGGLEEDVDQDIEEIFEVPGTYFSALSNACQQQRESFRLASIEAATAVEDVHEAHEKVEAMKNRMEKAEKHLTKLWEENCTSRKSLKQKKREKRVLVREVKALQQLTKEMTAERPPSRGPSRVPQENEGPVMEDTLVGSDEEERMIIELEEHVASSIRLHGQFLAANDFGEAGTETDLNTSIDGSEVVTNRESSNFGTASHGATLRFENSSVSEHGGRQSPLQPTALQPKLMSLMDDEESDSDSDDDVGVNEYQSMTPSIVSSVGAEFGDATDCGDSIASEFAFPPIPSEDSSPERPNPVLELDEEEEDEYERQPKMCAASTQSTSSKSVIFDNGQATSRLVCPLADVVETKGPANGSNQSNKDHNVYHLSFYSRKIGIQFQKAPPAPTRPKGLLTAAMTADLAGEVDASENTAAELRSIASISSLASGRNAYNEEVCPVATPEDIVLVCGFDGFDDSGMNQRPKLGARLVAFDGVSVEIGHWTFVGIRKAIKACGRPLTLSFRDDYLTTEQRAVLTKAVMDVDAKCPPPRPTVPYGVRHRPPSTTPSVNSALSHETDCFVNDGYNQAMQFQDNDLSAIVTADTNCCHQKIAAASNSVSTQYGRLRRLSSSSHSTHQSSTHQSSTHQNSTHQSNFRSFSEAGSSISTSFAPLMANLMKGVSDRKEEFTPQYLQRAPESLDNSPQHQDFQSNLL